MLIASVISLACSTNFDVNVTCWLILLSPGSGYFGFRSSSVAGVLFSLRTASLTQSCWVWNWSLNIVRYKFCKWQLYIGLLTRNQPASSHCMERFSNSWWDTIAWSSSSHSWGFKKKNYLAKKNGRSWFDWVQLLRTRVWIPILNPNDTLQHLYHDWRHDLDLSLLQGEAHQRTRVYFALQSLSIPALHSIHGFQQMLTIIYEFMWAEGYISISANGSMIVMVTVCITWIRWEI